MEQLDQWLESICRPGFDEGCRSRALAEMRAAGIEAVFSLLTARLWAADPSARCDAIEAMLFLDARRAVPAAVAMLFDPSPVVRWSVSGCLHDFGDERAVGPLMTVLERDPDPQVRGIAAFALGGIGSPEALPALVRALDDRALDKLGYSVRQGAECALREILGTGYDRSTAQCRYQEWIASQAEPRAAPDPAT